MNYLFEQSDSLNRPLECFLYEASKNTFPVKPHWHYFMEVIYMLDGVAKMCTEDQEYTVKKGDLVIFPPQEVHSIYKADSEQEPRYIVLKFDLNQITMPASYIPKIRSVFKAAKKNKMPLCFSKKQVEKLPYEEGFRECLREMQQQQFGYDVIIRSNIQKLLLSVIRFWQDEGFFVQGGDELLQAGTYEVETITEYMDKHLADNMQVAELAKLCGLSYSCFAKKFHYLYGMGCKEYMEQQRVYKVEELLLFTECDLNYISSETGFSDSSHMIKSFRKLRGCTPAQFRRKNRAVEN